MGDPRGPTVALVPFRTPGEGLSRLEGRLLRSERAALASAMLADVVRALRATVERVVVVASGAGAVGVARVMGLDVVMDAPSTRGVDAAVRAAVPRVVTGPASVLVAMADLPLLTPQDVEAVLAADAQVTIAPTSDGGTGLLLRRPVSCIETAYGPGSAARHMRLGRLADVTTTSITTSGARLDVDTVEDLWTLLDHPPPGATGAVFERVRSRVERARDTARSSAGVAP